MPNTTFKKRIRLKGFDYQGYFRDSLTFCTKNKSPYFDNHMIVFNVAGILQETARLHDFKIWSCCFMPDHVHVLVEGESQSADLKKFASAFKQKSGYWFKQIQKEQATLKGCPTKNNDGKSVGQGFSLAGRHCIDLWQVNYYEHVLRSDDVTEKVTRYILENPVRNGLAADYREYPFSWCQVFDFVGQGFSLAESEVERAGEEKSATLKGCPTNANPGQGRARLQPCEVSVNAATLKGCPTKVKKGNQGFTLIEIVITIVLVSILAGIAALIILQGVKAYSDEQSRSDVHYQARLAMERMAREIRHIRSCAAITGPANPASTLSFTDITGTVVTFSVSAGNLSRGANILATGIMSAQPFRFLDQNGNETTACSVPTVPTDIWYVDISLTAQQGAESLVLNSRVHPRNF